MLKFLVSLALRRRAAVFVITLWVAGYGSYVAWNAPLDVFPDFIPTQVTVQTESPGLTAEQVEQLVTQPLESVLASAVGAEDVRSESIQGLSIINIIFREGSELFQARTVVSELLSEAARRLPEGVEPPRMTLPTSTTMDLLKVGFVSDALSSMELRTFVDYVVAPRLRACAGVAGISIFGGEIRQLHIDVDAARLAAFSLTLRDVEEAARAATGVRGAGFVDTPGQRILLETRGQATTPREIGESLILLKSGAAIRLLDVAKITYAPQLKFGDALIQGKPGVLLTMLSQYGANTLEATRAVEGALDELAPALERSKIQIFRALHRPATFIENALANLQHSLWLGAALVAIILILFLNDIRAAIISLTAIPLSLLIAIMILERFGVTMNTMTLGGLALALGEVIDDAIIDVENIQRRLRVNHDDAVHGRGIVKSPFLVVLEASLEVRSAVVYATLVVGFVFLPIIFLSGLHGKLFAPLGIAYILSTGASLLVALTVTPALSLLWLPRAKYSHREPRVQTILKSAYGSILQFFEKARVAVLGAVLLLCAGAVYVLLQMGGEFLPVMREGHFVIHVTQAPGASLEEMKRLGARLADEMLKIPEVATVEQQIGRAELGEDPWGPNQSEFHVELHKIKARDEEKVENEIRAALERFPGIQLDIMTFLGDRIGESIGGETAPVILQIFGDDLDILDTKAAQAARILKNTSGAVDVQFTPSGGLPRMNITIRRDRLEPFSVRAGDVLAAVETAFAGRVVAEIYDANKIIDVVVFLSSAASGDPNSLASVDIYNMRGEAVPLSAVATIDPSEGRASILHDGGRRRQTLHCNVRGRDLDSFVRDARDRIGRLLNLPSGFYFAFTGAAEQSGLARSELLRNAATAAAAILLLLAIVFRNLQNLLLVLLNLPFAMVGGVFAVWFAGAPLSMGSLVGFITLFGVSTRNSMMLVSHYQHLVEVENATWNLETALRGARERLLPILMTALVTALALLPIALGSGEAGRELEGPMAIVIVGGLFTSTLLNLLILPILCGAYGRFAPAAAEY